MPNITIVGAGSAIFSMDLIINICVRESLWGSTIILMDISEKRLNTIYALAERYRDEAKAELHFRKTMDRREALEGAEFVICAVKEGGYDPMEKEREIAEEHGYYRGIGDRVSDYYAGMAEQQSASLLKEFPLQKNLEQHIPIVDALANDKQTILRLNIPNKGSIDGIPDDVVVEIPALVSGSGIQPIRVGKLPAKLMHHVLIPRMNRMEQILHAFLRHDRESLVLGLMEDSRT